MVKYCVAKIAIFFLHTDVDYSSSTNKIYNRIISNIGAQNCICHADLFVKASVIVEIGLRTSFLLSPRLAVKLFNMLRVAVVFFSFTRIFKIPLLSLHYFHRPPGQRDSLFSLAWAFCLGLIQVCLCMANWL